MARKKKEDYLIIKVPAHQVGIILDSVEQMIEDIDEAGCDCDDCETTSAVLTELCSEILGAAQLEKI